MTELELLQNINRQLDTLILEIQETSANMRQLNNGLHDISHHLREREKTCG